MARRISGDGRVTVSLRRSIGRRVTSLSSGLGGRGSWGVAARRGAPEATPGRARGHAQTPGALSARTGRTGARQPHDHVGEDDGQQAAEQQHPRPSGIGVQ